MTPVQIFGALFAIAGIAWMFLHPGAKGEGEASYAGITLKSLTQGGLALAEVQALDGRLGANVCALGP